MDIGHVTDTLIEAHLAESLAEPRSDEELQARAQRYLADGTPAPAAAMYRELAAAQPESFDRLLYLLQAQLRTDPIAALSTIERARQLPEAAESPELDRMKALALRNFSHV